MGRERCVLKGELSFGFVFFKDRETFENVCRPIGVIQSNDAGEGRLEGIREDGV